MYPETIIRTDCDDRAHPEYILMELFQGKYRVHDCFWDGVNYQSHTVGARYGYQSLRAAEKAHWAQVGKVKAHWHMVQQCKAENERRLAAEMPPAPAPTKPRVSIAAIARQVFPVQLMTCACGAEGLEPTCPACDPDVLKSEKVVGN